MARAVEGAALLLLWGAVLAKLFLTGAGSRASGARLLSVALVMVAGAITVDLHLVYLPLDRALGGHNLSCLLVYGQALVAVWALYQVLELDLARSVGSTSSTRRGRYDLPVTLAALAATFVAGPARLPDVPKVNAHTYATPGTAAFFTVAVVAVSFFVVRSFVAARRLARHAALDGRRLLATGLRLMNLAGVLGLTNNVYQILIFPPLARLSWANSLSDVLTTSGYAAGGLLGLGIVLPAARSWHPLVLAAAAVRQRVAFLALYPLWRDLADVTPGIVLAPSSSRLSAAVAVRDVGYRLYRRVIEIRDGLRAVQPFMAAVEVQTGAGSSGPGQPDMLAGAQAAALAAAVHRKRRGVSLAGPATPAVEPVVASLAEEVEWLSRVSRHYRRHSRRHSRRVGSAA